MKSLKNISLIAVAVLITTTSTLASNTDSSNISNTDDAVATYSSASELFAESAMLTLSNKNFMGALKWIDKSIEAEETAENLEMKGDLLSSRQMNNSAIKYYHRALLKSKEQNPADSNERLQAKIWNVR